MVGEDSCIIGPVQKVGSELGGDFPFEGLEGVEHQGVFFQGFYNFLVEVHVDEVYKQGVGEEGDPFIVIVDFWD